MEEQPNNQSPIEIEDRIRVLKDREETLRKDYDKCIAWRVRVVFHNMKCYCSTFRH